MPRAKRGGKRSRAPKDAARRLREMKSLLLDIEVPLRDAMHYVHALQIIGSGLIAEGDNGGEPVIAVARAAEERLEKVEDIWNRIFESERTARPR